MGLGNGFHSSTLIYLAITMAPVCECGKVDQVTRPPSWGGQREDGAVYVFFSSSVFLHKAWLKFSGKKLNPACFAVHCCLIQIISQYL